MKQSRHGSDITHVNMKWSRHESYIAHVDMKQSHPRSNITHVDMKQSRHESTTDDEYCTVQWWVGDSLTPVNYIIVITVNVVLH